MKTKAAALGSRELLKALNSPELARIILQRVGIEILGLKNPGPAEFYVQECDKMIDLGLGDACEVRMSGVSVTTSRSTEDFHRALKELEAIYKSFILKTLPAGKKVQLFVVLMLDTIPFGEKTSILETQPIWVVGQI